MSLPDYNRRNLALAFAARAHREQIRKGTDEQPDDLDTILGRGVPYFMHPAAVGMILIEHEASDDAVIAGILHDVLEDANVPVSVLEQTFGSRVAQLVVAESEPDKSLSWRERKEHTIRNLADCEDEDVKLVAAADKLHNVQSIKLDLERFGHAVWDRFNANKDAQAWYYHAVSEALSQKGRDHELFNEFRRTVNGVFG